MLSIRDPPQNRRFSQAENEVIGNIYSMQQTWKKNPKTGMAILISDKIDFKKKAITRDKEGHYVILKGVVQQGIYSFQIHIDNR